jgi:hypothetical protein
MYIADKTMCHVPKQNEFSFQDLGKHKLGKGCLYIKKLSDVDITVLKKHHQKSCSINAVN